MEITILDYTGQTVYRNYYVSGNNGSKETVRINLDESQQPWYVRIDGIPECEWRRKEWYRGDVLPEISIANGPRHPGKNKGRKPVGFTVTKKEIEEIRKSVLKIADDGYRDKADEVRRLANVMINAYFEEELTGR